MEHCCDLSWPVIDAGAPVSILAQSPAERFSRSTFTLGFPWAASVWSGTPLATAAAVATCEVGTVCAWVRDALPTTADTTTRADTIDLIIVRPAVAVEE